MAKYGPDPTLRDMILGQVVKMALLEEAHAAHRKELSAVKSAVSALRSKIDGTQWRDMERRIASMQQSMEDIDTLREMAKALRVVFESEPGWDDR
jgi:hypothetical protein